LKIDLFGKNRSSQTDFILYTSKREISFLFKLSFAEVSKTPNPNSCKIGFSVELDTLELKTPPDFGVTKLNLIYEDCLPIFSLRWTQLSRHEN
jgi:hypothetical protein